MVALAERRRVRAVTRFSVPIDVSERFVSISPDGSRVAYRAGRSVHPCPRSRRVRARRIPGTGGGRSIFRRASRPTARGSHFSPAARLEERCLYSAGPHSWSRRIRRGQRLHWGEDGYLYFATNSGVMRAHESGGPAELVVGPERRAQRDFLPVATAAAGGRAAGVQRLRQRGSRHGPDRRTGF